MTDVGSMLRLQIMASDLRLGDVVDFEAPDAVPPFLWRASVVRTMRDGRIYVLWTCPVTRKAWRTKYAHDAGLRRVPETFLSAPIFEALERDDSRWT